jgi:PST family polysaccharide transporter
MLRPSEFGLYAIATFIVEILGLFGNFGLAPSFIQRRREPTDDDLAVGFTLQQIVATVLVGVIVVIAPWVMALFPGAPDGSSWLIRALAFSLYLTSWRSISALQLERRLRYDRLAWIEVIEALSFQATAVTLAALGHGVWSFGVAALVRGVLGTVLVYLAAPWPVRLKLDRRVTREILGFGVPFQLQILANQAGNWVTPLFVGTVVGTQGVGFLTWASSNARKPLLLVDNVMRVAFPHFSRIQDDREEVERLLVRYLTYLLLPAGAWFAVLLVAGHSLVIAIYSEKWSPAVFALILFALALFVDVIQWVFAVTLNSLGLVKSSTRILLVRNALSIAISIPLVLAVGFNGVPVAYLAAGVIIGPWFLVALGRELGQRVMRALLWIFVPLIAGVLAGIPILLPSLPTSVRAVSASFLVLTAYGAAAWLKKPQWLEETIRSVHPFAWVVGRLRAYRASAVG